MDPLKVGELRVEDPLEWTVQVVGRALIAKSAEVLIDAKENGPGVIVT